METQFVFLTANLSGTAPKRQVLNGREYLIASATIFPPGGGVMNGSKGPLFYPREVCAAKIGAWNNYPLTGKHPVSNDGKHISASTAGAMDRQGIGFITNDRMDGDNRRVDCWFDIDATRNYDSRNGTSILQGVLNGRLQEVSTGLVTQDQPAANGAEFNGKVYSFTVTNWTPDHLAVLPDQRGAC